MLNEAQRIRMECVLRAVEDKMRSIQDLMDRQDQSGLMSELISDLAPDSRMALQETIPGVYDRIKSLRDRFELDRETRSASREMLRGLSLLWVALQESDSQHLRGYGGLSPTDAQSVDSEIERLAGWMLDLERIVAPRTAAQVSVHQQHRFQGSYSGE